MYRGTSMIKIREKVERRSREGREKVERRST
jgi:hypothetical protein